MDLIHPNEIGTKISTLIAESQGILYIISPFLQLSKWKKITSNLIKAKIRGVRIAVFYREIDDTEYKFLNSLNIELYQINGLHTKLYINDSEIIVSSMNLYEYSDYNAIELGLYYNDPENYHKIYEYFKKYILQAANNNYAPAVSKPLSILENLYIEFLRCFTNCKFVLADGYIFSSNLIKGFDVMISECDITLKLPIKQPNSEQLEQIINLFSKLTSDFEITFNPPSEEYTFATWNIGASNLSHVKILNIFFSVKLNIIGD
jgi:hypothetical protein